MADDMYQPLFAYKSWTILFFRFLFHRKLEVYRLARQDENQEHG